MLPVLAGGHKGLDHARPGTCHIAPVVTTAAGADDTARAMLVGDVAQRCRCLCVRRFGIAKVRDGVALKTVGATLKQDELWPGLAKILLNTTPSYAKFSIAGAGSHRDIEFGASSPARAGLGLGAGTRIQVAAIFVYIGKYEVRIVFESIEHPVAVVCVDIDVSNAAQTVLLAQVFGGDTAIIEDAKTSGPIPPRMMQARDGNKRTASIAVHNVVCSRQYGANDIGRCIEDSLDGRRVTVIQVTLARRR